MKSSRNAIAVALRRCCAFLIAALLLVSMIPSGEVFAEKPEKLNRLNVMLVLDGSGSLRAGTDKTGLRYDAIDLFLALLTNDGNNVGAIVFNHDILLHSSIAPISGKSGKMALSNKIREAGCRGDTDIGAALLKAVDESITANQQNGLKSVVLLFSDGRTDVPGGEEGMEASLAKKEEAITKAQGAGIPVYTICLNASSVSSPDELEDIASRTSGKFDSVEKAGDLAGVFEEFYKLIFNGKEIPESKAKFSESGKLSCDIQIPSYGAEEVNIIFDATGVKGRSITSPSGMMSETEVEDSTMSGGQYDIIKLVAPENGKWKLELTGTPGAEVTVNVLYNIDSSATLKKTDGKTDYDVGDSVTFQANLLQQGQVVTDKSVTDEYVAKLTLTNLANGEKEVVDMVADANGAFVYTMTGSDYCSWSASVELSYANLKLTSNSQAVNFGNTAPVATTATHEVKATVTPISGKSRTVKVSDFFSDAQDSQLTYSIVSNQLVKDTVDFDEKTGELVINTGKSRSGDLVIQATDSQGATAQMTIQVKVTNLSGLIFGIIVAAVVAGIIVLAVILFSVLNRPWKGMFTVIDLDTGIERTHGGFRGKVNLAKLGFRSSGLDGAFVATGHNRMEFRSKKHPIYSGSGFQPDAKRIPLMNGTNTIYSDENHTQGITVEVSPRP